MIFAIAYIGVKSNCLRQIIYWWLNHSRLIKGGFVNIKKCKQDYCLGFVYNERIKDRGLFFYLT